MKVANPGSGAFAFVLCLLFLLPTGCVYAPLLNSNKPISSADFSFMRSGHTDRGTVEAKMGKPVEYFPDSRVSVYPVNKITRHKLVLFLGFLPIAFFRDTDGYKLACIQFDEHDRVQRWGFTTEYLGLQKSALEVTVKKWLAGEPQDK